MGGRVVYRDSQGRDGSIELSATETVYVGRGLECAIRTDDAMVSRRHSQIRMEGGRFVVEDLGSANGTLVNNARIQKQQLNHNDVVQCGSLWLRFFDDGQPVAMMPMAGAVAGPPPGGKKGTMVLDPAEAPGGAAAIAAARAGRPIDPPPPPPRMGSPGGAPAMPSNFGGPPAMPGGGGPYGGPPAMPGGGGPPAMPGGGPPAMPGGGPPAMPG